MAAFGALMSASHASSRDDFANSSPALDALIEAAEAAPGFLGGKLSGAGWAGCTVNLVADARTALERLSAALGDHRATGFEPRARAEWLARVDAHCAAPGAAQDGPSRNALPTDAQVIGAVQRASTERTVALSAAGTMPGALKLLWQASQGGYHMEYGFSCMGYELAGALGAKLALPGRDVVCFVGDGSYMMANSELATAVMRRVPFTVVLTDNRGYGCINRLQLGCGGKPSTTCTRTAPSRSSRRSTSSPTRGRWAPTPSGPWTSRTSKPGSPRPATATAPP